jgi:hypothetical protein
MKTLPSRAYSVRSPIFQATVEMRRLADGTARVPVFCRRKHPVPYVFFVSPGDTHICPKSAACWSPAIPAIGTSATPRLVDTRP